MCTLHFCIFSVSVKVRSVIWSQDDTKIISCGMDGAVYEWNAYTGKRDGESVLKSCSYTGVAVSPDGRTTFAVGSDKTLKEICDSQVKHYLYIIETIFSVPMLGKRFIS